MKRMKRKYDMHCEQSTDFCFVHPISRFWFLVTSSDKVTKMTSNLCLHFARQDGQDGKNWKENHGNKVTKIPKTKRRKYGMNERQVKVLSLYYASIKKFFVNPKKQ